MEKENKKSSEEASDFPTREEIEKTRLSGYVRGEYFSGEWLDGTPMDGYGIYYVSEGEISNYGGFSESGEIADEVDAGDLIEAFREKKFLLLRRDGEG